MPVLTTFVELQDQVMLLAGMSGQTDRSLAKRTLNIAYNTWWTRHGWRMKRAEGWGLTKAPFSSSDTVTIEQTSVNQLTLTGAIWPANIERMKIGIPGLQSPWYRVLTRDSDTLVTLDRDIPASVSIPAGTSFYAYSDEIDLTDYTDMEALLTNWVTLHDTNGQGTPIRYQAEADAVERGFPRGVGFPNWFCEGYPDISAAGNIRVLHVGPLAPANEYQVHFFYERTQEDMVDDTDEPEIPVAQRAALVYGALADVYRQDEFRDTDLAERADGKFEAELYRAWKYEKRGRPRQTFIRPFDFNSYAYRDRLHFTVNTV